MNKNALLIGAVIALVLIGGYWAFADKAEDSTTITSQEPVVTSGGDPQPGSIHDMPVEPAAAAARKDLAAKLSVEEKSIVIMLIEDKTWNDGCLGLGKPAESCVQAHVDGFRVEMLAQGKTYIYRTDKTGSQVRMEGN